MKDKLLIIGASGHGKVVADVALKMDKWKSIAFLDDNPRAKSSLGLNVIDNTSNIEKYILECDLFVAIGNNKLRKNLIEKLEILDASIPILIHPNAVIGKEVFIGKGTVIMGGAVINPSTTVGKGCIINTAATIDHDNEIGDYVHISPGVNLAGTVRIGNKTWIGAGCAISNNIEICNDCIVGAGGVVINDLCEPGTYVGVPVKKIK